ALPIFGFGLGHIRYIDNNRNIGPNRLTDEFRIIIRARMDGTQFVHFSVFLSGLDHTFDRCDRSPVVIIFVWYSSWTTRWWVLGFDGFLSMFGCRWFRVFVGLRGLHFTVLFYQLLLIGFVAIGQTHSDHGFP